ncbi:tetratricopeptide repeat protein [Treponema sp.]|uniref:tetratricopeptide repeat protein n=1 Tax=Treponema sp. TaxID=166 RepID=UPI0025D37D69|nr:tetratricopeptide repeat protein [Treponema sp.]MCR5218827.1 tetratricopeptide repeat protein [Treponema sp.]
MGIQSQSAFEQAYKLMEICCLEEAGTVLNDTLTSDLDNKDIVYSIQYCAFWQKTLEKLPKLDSFDQGESLVNHWKDFMTVIQPAKVLKESEFLGKTVYSLKKGIFSQALECYTRALDRSTGDESLCAEINRKRGLCYKKLGSYENALECLSQSVQLLPNNAAAVAEKADCYALCGETRYAKLLFKEAFFMNARKIDFDFLDSPLINLLINEVRAKGYEGDALHEWIPVYGVLLGVFNKKRELKFLEVLRLKQEIYSRENELKDPSCNSAVVTPRLINLYFRLIDHYVLSKENIASINEILLKIRDHDRTIWKIYVNE